MKKVKLYMTKKNYHHPQCGMDFYHFAPSTLGLQLITFLVLTRGSLWLVGPYLYPVSVHFAAGVSYDIVGVLFKEKKIGQHHIHISHQLRNRTLAPIWQTINVFFFVFCGQEAMNAKFV